MSITTMFPSPQFPLKPDPAGPRMYANVSNLLEVTQDQQSYHVAVAVPTGLFLLMQQVLQVQTHETVHLSIDKVGERFVFAVMIGEDRLIDLWDYSENSLPAWIRSRAFIVRQNTQKLPTRSDL